MTDVRDPLGFHPRVPNVEITVKTVEFTIRNRVPPCSAMTSREFRQHLLAEYAELVAAYRAECVSAMVSQGGAS